MPARLPLALALALALAVALPAAAQPSASAAAPEPDTIVVTGLSLAVPPGTAAYGAIVIGRDRLANAASGRIEDVLRDVAGFQQFRRTDSRAANPTSQGVTLRALGGNASSRALVLLDGVPQADPFAGYIPFAALAPERLAYARVTRGGGIGAFGAGAVAGTIELESAGPSDLGPLTGRAFYGSRDASELSASIAAELGQGLVTLDGRRDRGDGFTIIPEGQRGPVDVPARYAAWSVGLRAITPVTATSELQVAGRSFDDRRLRGQAGTESESRGTDTSIRLISRGRWQLDALAYVQDRDFASGFVATAPDRALSTPSLDQFKTPSLGLGGKIELRPPTGRDNVLRLGLDARHASGHTHERFRFQGAQFTRLRRAGGSTLTTGAFIEEDLSLGRVVLTAGARIDHWRIEGGTLRESDLQSAATTQALAFPDRSGWERSLRGGALWRASDALSLRGAAYAGFRLPTLNELYRPFRVGADATAANAALGLERLRGVEGGLDFRPWPGTRLGLTGFYNRLQGAIANATIGRGPGLFDQVGFVAAGGVFRQRVNVDAVEVAGLEATAESRAGGFTASASYALSDPRVRASGVAAALDRQRPAQSPRHQASATIAWSGRSADASLTLRHVGAQFEDDLQSRRLPPATTLDAVAAVEIADGLRLVGRAENLTDTRIVSGLSATGIEDLGTPRSVWIGFSYRPPAG